MHALSTPDLVRTLSASVRQHLARHPEHAGDSLDTVVHVYLNRTAPHLSLVERADTQRRVLAEIRGLGALEALLDEEGVTEVSVNAGTDVWVDRHGSMTRAGSIDPSELALLVERAIAPLGLRFDRSSPIVDARLAHGHRLCAVMPPLAIDGLCVSIRRFALRHATLEAFAPAEVCRLLIALVGERCNIVVSGGTSSGKTTLLNALAAYTLPHERLITIEDTAELELQCPHVLRLESRPATPDGVEAVTVRQLLKAALRLRPDRIVVGEVRGAEAFDMVQALNTGHDGSLSTVHANSPADALRRIVSLAELGAPGQSPLLLEEQVHSSIDIIVHLVRRHDGSRHIAAVSEVLPGAASGAPTRLLADANGVVDTPRRGRVTTDGHTP